MSAFRDKLLSIAAPRRFGKSETVRVPREDGPGTAGFHTKHWDGRQDAVATPGTIVVKVRPQQIEERRPE